MKQFINKLIIICLVFFAIIELISRFLIDPLYFHSINTYDEKKDKSLKNIYKSNETTHVDFLFIGSSRIPATINPKLISELSNGKTVVTAGRGNMTPGIHYQAIKNKLEQNPDYLKNAIVLIEYAGSQVYTSNFEQDKYQVHEPLDPSDKPMPHLLLPHLNRRSFLSFLKESKNSSSVKKEMVLLYLFSSYRACQYVNDKFNYFDETKISVIKNNTLASDGGIRHDHLEFAKQLAITIANQTRKEINDSPFLSEKIMDNSSFAKLYETIIANGGTLMVYEMPLHSVQMDTYKLEKAQKNKIIFEEWLKTHNITIVYNPKFKFDDNDFPDTWHLSLDRRNEFSSLLYEEILKAQTLNKN